MYWLVRTHVQTCVPLWVMEHSRVSLTAHVCYTKGCTQVYAAWVDTYVGMYTYATGVSPTCSRQNLKRIVLQGTYSSDIISSYLEWTSKLIKILTSRELCKFPLFVSKKKDGVYGWVGCTDRWVTFCNFCLFVLPLYKYTMCGHWWHVGTSRVQLVSTHCCDMIL